MRLIVHMGFHKTASTHLQALMNGNCEAMAAHGVWYEHHPHATHHHIANPLLAQNALPFAAMLADAQAAGCHTAILSSENLEALPFVPDVTALIERVAAEQGVTEIEWHAALREPGAYFASIHSQLSWHTYADALHMFSEVMKKGALFLPEPHPGDDATPYWFFCFDYLPFLDSFAAEDRRLFVHDYADRDPYPGWRLVRRLGLLDVMVKQPEDWGYNHRLDPEAAAHFFRERLREAAGDEETWQAIRVAARRHMSASAASVPILAEQVGRRFAASYLAAIEMFGQWDPEPLASAA
jgi:hypothetical protein